MGEVPDWSFIDSINLLFKNQLMAREPTSTVTYALQSSLG